MPDAITPFTINIPQSALDDLRQRLDATRWPDPETVEDWSQGVPLAKLQAVVEYWRTSYDWRRCEAMLNAYPQFTTEIDGIAIHFLHIRSPHQDALPLLMTHGWPGSVIEFHKVIGPLTNPTAHGGEAKDAFHLVLPSLPGYGFSGKPTDRGWNVQRIARAWIELVRRLGYDRWVVQGGDWGAGTAMAIAGMAPKSLAGIHVNLLTPGYAGGNIEPIDDEEREMLRLSKHYIQREALHFWQQSTRPQTLGYALADSPVGQCAWIYERIRDWTDCNGDPETVLTLDEILDNITLYWLTNSATSSARLYAEVSMTGAPKPIHIPFGYSLFPKEHGKAARRWMEPMLTNIIHWNKLDRGGHFPASEQPELFVDEVRTCFRKVR